MTSVVKYSTSFSTYKFLLKFEFFVRHGSDCLSVWHVLNIFSSSIFFSFVASVSIFAASVSLSGAFGFDEIRIGRIIM